MTQLQEHLFRYIMEDRHRGLSASAAYLQSRQERDEAQETLAATLTAEQQRLFFRYTDAENTLTALEEQHIFRETLSILPAMLR